MKPAVSMIVALGLFISAHTLPAFAQQQLTLGDILAKGAKKLTKEEIRKLASGATISGTQVGKPEITFQNKYMPDGSVTGDGWRNGVFVGKISGRWWISDIGQFCNYLQNGGVQSCYYYFGLGNQFDTVKGEATTELVYERKFTR